MLALAGAGSSLAALDARTDHNGCLAEVRGQTRGGRFDLQVRDRGHLSYRLR